MATFADSHRENINKSIRRIKKQYHSKNDIGGDLGYLLANGVEVDLVKHLLENFLIGYLVSPELKLNMYMAEDVWLLSDPNKRLNLLASTVVKILSTHLKFNMDKKDIKRVEATKEIIANFKNIEKISKAYLVAKSRNALTSSKNHV